MNICAKCKHFKTARAGAIWYDQYCGHPTHERVLTVDPVSGTSCYMGTNDLGGTYTTEEKHPNARDINTHGECPTFEERWPAKAKGLLGRILGSSDEEAAL